MDVNSLIIFKKIVEQGSFTAAAKLLEMPKSLVSQRISKLEDDLGLRLLQRTTRKISVTDEGQQILLMASEIVEHIDEIKAFADKSSERPQGLLRVTAPHDLGIYIIHEVLPEFLSLYKDVEIELDLTNRYVDLVEEGFDLALRAVGGSGALRDSSYIAKKLANTALHFYCRPDYSPIPEQIEELPHHPVISFRRPEKRRKTTVELHNGKKKVSVDVSGPLRTSDMLGCKNAVVAGMGIGLLPEFLVAPEVRSGQLTPILKTWTALPATFYVIHPSKRHVSTKAKYFVDFLQKHFQL